jgi:hypothetical protein
MCNIHSANDTTFLLVSHLVVSHVAVTCAAERAMR